MGGKVLMDGDLRGLTAGGNAVTICSPDNASDEKFVPSPTGTRFLFFRLPRTYVLGYHMPPLRGWHLPASFYLFTRGTRCSEAGGDEDHNWLLPRSPFFREE